MSEAWLDKLDDAYDEDNPMNAVRAMKVLNDGIRDYQERFTRIVDDVPSVDLPLFLAAVKLAYDAFLASLPLPGRESVDAVLSLPFSTALVRFSGGGDDHG